MKLLYFVLRVPGNFAYYFSAFDKLVVMYDSLETEVT